MMKLTAVFLTKTSSQEIYEMTLDCLRTMLEFADSTLFDISVVLVESNKKSLFEYPDTVMIVTPDEEFNFHRFLNFGMQREPKSDWYLLCNNDLLFYPHWLNEVEKIMLTRTDIESFSPISPTCKDQTRLIKDIDLISTPFLLGFDRRQHLSGWCFMVKKEALEKIGGLDERFSFYFADDDYALSLRRFNILHALVLQSKVEHLEDRKISKKLIQRDESLAYEEAMPSFLSNARYSWILENEKMLEGFMAYTSKWGDMRLIRLKRKIHDILFLRLGVRIFSKLLFKKLSIIVVPDGYRYE